MTRILAALALAGAVAGMAVASGISAPHHRARTACTPIVVEGIPGRFCADPARGR